jgi:choline dehydrogenase
MSLPLTPINASPQLEPVLARDVMPIDGDPAQGPQTRVTFDRFEPDRVSGVEFSHHDEIHRVGAGSEVVLSLGAIHTSKVLMQSGIGDPPNCTDMASPCCSTFPGWSKPAGPSWFRLCLGVPTAAPVAQHWVRGDLLLEERPWSGQPDLQTCQAELPKSSAENVGRFGLPDAGWTLFAGVVRPQSRGHICLTGPDPCDPVQIQPNMLSHPDDLKAAIASVDLCPEIGNSAPRNDGKHHGPLRHHRRTRRRHPPGPARTLM